MIEALQVGFLVFCRVGGCLMVMPGISSPRIPMQARLFVALGVSLALSPIVFEIMRPDFPKALAENFLLTVITEVHIGLLFGLLARFYFLALQFMAVAIAGFVGLGAMPGAPIADGEPAPSIATFIVVVATMLLFAADLHLQIVRALVDTYGAIPVSSIIGADVSVERLSVKLTETFSVALQISGPFIVYAIAINFLFGIANKMVPQIPVYFISLPFVVAGGLIAAYFVLPEMLTILMRAFAGWLADA